MAHFPPSPYKLSPARMANTANVHDAASALDLGHIRSSLMRMEDSIIFSLIERSQYRLNAKVYEPDCAYRCSPQRCGLR